MAQFTSVPTMATFTQSIPTAPATAISQPPAVQPPGPSPAIGADGTIYIGSQDFNLYAVSPDDTLRWKFLANDGKTGDRLCSSPAIGADGTIYVGSWDYNLYAVKPDGTLRWKFAAGNPVVSSPAISADGTI